MGRTDAIKDKILKLGSKQKLGALLKYADNAEDDVRMTVAMAMGMIPNYESGMALIPLLRDSSPMVRAAAATAAGRILPPSWISPWLPLSRSTSPPILSGWVCGI